MGYWWRIKANLNRKINFIIFLPPILRCDPFIWNGTYSVADMAFTPLLLGDWFFFWSWCFYRAIKFHKYRSRIQINLPFRMWTQSRSPWEKCHQSLVIIPRNSICWIAIYYFNFYFFICSAYCLDFCLLIFCSVNWSTPLISISFFHRKEFRLSKIFHIIRTNYGSLDHVT